MISLVLYGRNDSYGYNLHKRAALSLNCMAEVLTEPMDEILFVDYNTPDDYPTFPEAIQDTLTGCSRTVSKKIPPSDARAHRAQCRRAPLQSRESLDTIHEHRYDIRASQGHVSIKRGQRFAHGLLSLAAVRDT
jgi:hypothetical protein